MTIAMAPKALGTNNRVRIILRPKRLACSAMLPPPSHAPPRIVLALRALLVNRCPDNRSNVIGHLRCRFISA